MQYTLKCNISRNKQIMNCNFGVQINIEVFYKLILLFWAYEARHGQSMQNEKFAYLYNISRKTGDEVDFLPGDKPKSFLQFGNITLGVPKVIVPNFFHTHACPKYPK